jgi:hypothetical protein
MLRYKYENAFDFTRRYTCGECRYYKKCRLGRKTNPEIGICAFGGFTYSHPKIISGTGNSNNIDWLIFQILRSAQLSKIMAENIITKHRTNWIKPDSLKDIDLDNGPTVIECLAFMTALDAFLKFGRKKRDEYNLLKGNKDGIKKGLIEAIIDTKILVKNKEVIVYTKRLKDSFIDELSSCLENRIRKAVKAEGYSFTVAKTEAELEGWNSREEGRLNHVWVSI